jgi:hypothetical protein
MLAEALSAGFFESLYSRIGRFPHLQILTIEDLLAGKQIEYPRILGTATFKKAERIKRLKEIDQKLPFESYQHKIRALPDTKR